MVERAGLFAAEVDRLEVRFPRNGVQFVRLSGAPFCILRDPCDHPVGNDRRAWAEAATSVLETAANACLTDQSSGVQSESVSQGRRVKGRKTEKNTGFFKAADWI
jgi:hypothetical protein